MREQNKLLWFISNSKRLTLIAFFLGGYFFVGILFGILYWAGGMTSANDLFSNLYFSLMVQMSLGWEQIFPTTVIGRFFILLQFLFGTLWLVFMPSAIIVRLITPGQHVFQFDEYVVFYPEGKTFRSRYANLSKMNAVDVKFDMRARVAVSDESYNIRNLSVEINNPNPPDARSLIPFFLRTKDLEPDQFTLPDVNKDFSLLLHPGHIRGDMDLVLRVSCIYSTGLFNKVATYDYQHIVCGKFVPIQPGRDIPPNWDNFNKYILIEETEGGIEYCKQKCGFRDRCRIGNKVI